MRNGVTAIALVASSLLMGCQGEPPASPKPVQQGQGDSPSAAPPAVASAYDASTPPASGKGGGPPPYALPAPYAGPAPSRPAGSKSPPAAAESQAATRAGSQARADRVAAEGVAIIRKIGEAGDFGSMGFATVEEVRRARPGPAIPVFNVRLDSLRAYRRGQDPRPLLLPSSETVYPLLVGNDIRSSVSVVAVGDAYRIFGLGEAETIRRVSPYWRRGVGHEFIVRVPALNLQFLGRTSASGRVLLINVVEDERTMFRAGETHGADWFLERLVPLAREHNGALG